MLTQRCCKCHEDLPVTMYHRDKNRWSGYQGYCIPCRKKIDRKAFLSPERKKRVRELRRKQSTLIKERARAKVRREVRAGRLIRPTHCQWPGCLNPKVEAHHPEGYLGEKAVVVEWLCKRHHALVEHP